MWHMRHGRNWHGRTLMFGKVWRELKLSSNFNLKPLVLIPVLHLKLISEPNPDMADEPIESKKPANAEDKCPITFNKELPREHSVRQHSMLWLLVTCSLHYLHHYSTFPDIITFCMFRLSVWKSEFELLFDCASLVTW